MIEITSEELMNAALFPITWSHWVPKEIMDAILANISPTVPFSISCINGLWVVADKEFNALLSNAPVKINVIETKTEEQVANKSFGEVFMQCVNDMPKPPPPKVA